MGALYVKDAQAEHLARTLAERRGLTATAAEQSPVNELVDEPQRSQSEIACAKTNGAKLLYKGDDFRHTDLA